MSGIQAPYVGIGNFDDEREDPDGYFDATADDHDIDRDAE